MHAATRMNFQLVQACCVNRASNSAPEIEGFHAGQRPMMQRMYRRMSRRDTHACIGFSRPERELSPRGGYVDRFKSVFAIRGLGAGHERRHELHVQKEIAVPPVSTCSCFTKAESWHAGQTGTVGCESVGAEGFRIGHMRALDVRSLPLW
jgi:hypothetical protein